MALQAPDINTGTFNIFLRMLAESLALGEYALLIMDQAGRHISNKVDLPDNITAWLLPPCSPELNPVERVWAWKRSHHLANRAYCDYDHLLEAGAGAWQAVTPNRRRSICRCGYLTHRKET